MYNIFDYLIWRGDISIDSSNVLNEIDSLILSRFSYFPFYKIDFKEGKVFDILKRFENLNDEDFVNVQDKELIKLLINSNRFNNLFITNYERIYDESSTSQFCAVTILIPNDEIYISFIGTDLTIYGWKEDLKMSFMDNVSSQILGKKYLEKTANLYKDKKIRIGGFSKGGNISIYSSITTSCDIKKRIIKVYNYDGPGFSQEFLNKYNDEDIISKISTYIPEDSIIGRLLNHKEEVKIIESLEKHIYQHNIYTWSVLTNDFVYKNETTKFSDDIKKTIDNSLLNTTIEQRKIAIDAIFDIFTLNGVSTFKEISGSLIKSIPKILKNYKDLSREDKKNITNIVTIFIKSYISNSN